VQPYLFRHCCWPCRLRGAPRAAPSLPPLWDLVTFLLAIALTFQDNDHHLGLARGTFVPAHFGAQLTNYSPNQLYLLFW